MLKNAMLADDSAAVWCLRGGYGASKLIPELDKIDFSNTNKPIIGFSDITALHIYFTQKYNICTVHGRTLSEYFHKKVTELEIIKMKDLLLGKGYIQNLSPVNNVSKSAGSITAEITGGNLVLIESSLGTHWQINAKDKILLIEDAFERGYRIDRSLNHLKQAGIFDEVAAVIFGDISCEPEKNGVLKCEDAIEEFIKSSSVPIYRTNDFGHGKVNNPIIFGAKYIMDLGDKITLKLSKND